MDLRQLSALRHVVETGSFSEAAVRLGLTQPALSAQIRKLEEEFEERLFTRTGRGAVPTEAGLLLAERARVVLDEVERTRLSMTARKGVVAGHVSIGLPPSVGVLLTADLVTGARSEFADIALTVTEELSGLVQEGLLSGRLDLGLLYEGATSPALHCETLMAEELHLLAPPGQGIEAGRPIPFFELAGMELILPGRRHGLRAIVEQAAFRAGLRLTVSVEVDSLRGLSEIARRGLGPTIHAPSAFRQELAEGSLVAAPIIDPAIRRGIVLAWSKDRPLSRAGLAVAEIVRSLTRT